MQKIVHDTQPLLFFSLCKQTLTWRAFVEVTETKIQAFCKIKLKGKKWRKFSCPKRFSRARFKAFHLRSSLSAHLLRFLAFSFSLSLSLFIRFSLSLSSSLSSCLCYRNLMFLIEERNTLACKYGSARKGIGPQQLFNYSFD